MRICATEYGNQCLSVTYFPSSLKNGRDFFKTGNCYLHDFRCHEKPGFRSEELVKTLETGKNDIQTKTKSFYAFKELCNVKKICDMNHKYSAICNSKGPLAFPNLPKC